MAIPTAGDDTLEGSEGSDTIDAEAGDDFLHGHGGGDLLLGGTGHDTLDGGAGDDTLQGGGQTDHVAFSGAVRGVYLDLLLGIAQDGQGGTDLLSGITAVQSTAFSDTLLGSDADTNVESFQDAGGSDVVQGRGGQDEYVGHGNETYFIDLAAGRAWGFGGNDTVSGIERVRTGAAWDSLYGDEQDNLLDAGAGRDVLLGKGGNDTLLGGEGDMDLLVGSRGEDYLVGGAGSDQLYGDEDAASLVPQAFDVASWEDHTVAVTVHLWRDPDTNVGARATSSWGMDALVGIEGVRGGSANDTIEGGTLLHLEEMEGGAGDDVLDGGAITDLLHFDNSNRVSFRHAESGVQVDLEARSASGASTGNDSIANFNHVLGSAHADILQGTDSADMEERFEGGAGGDTIDGRGGFDFAVYRTATAGVHVDLEEGVAQGGAGHDQLANIEGVQGSSWDDTLSGGNSRSPLEVFEGGAGSDHIAGGAGFDRADYAGHAGRVVVDLATGRAYEYQDQILRSTDTLSGIEGVRGSAGGDLLSGSDRATFGEDGYSEWFDGGAGNDTLDGRGGADWAAYQTARTGVQVWLAGGTASDGLGGTDALANIENVQGSAFGDTLSGDVGANVLAGGAGDDSLVGGGGADELSGEAGNDTLDGRGGTAAMTGGTGDDTYLVDDPSDLVSEAGGSGWDTVRVLHGSPAAYVLGAGIESGVVDSAAAVDLTGNEMGNVLTGGAGANRLVGGEGEDWLDGGLGKDTLEGGADNDVYLVDLMDRVVEDAAGGEFDQVRVRMPAVGAYTLPDHVEGASVEALVPSMVTLIGNASNNVMVGHQGSDVLRGGAGDDFLIAGQGSDTFDGGAGTDVAVFAGRRDGYTVHERSNGSAVLIGNQASVVLTGVEWLLFQGENAAGKEDDTWVYVAQLLASTGTSSDDTVLGTSGPDLLSGFEGNDLVLGEAGNDTLRGGSGSDQLAGGEGDDVLEGQGGGDVYYYAPGDGHDRFLGAPLVDDLDVLVLAPGVGNIEDGRVAIERATEQEARVVFRDSEGNETGSFSFWLFVDEHGYAHLPLEWIYFHDGGAWLDAAAMLEQILTGGAGDDLVRGFAGADRLDGRDGHDTLVAGAGADQLLGGGGDDVLAGGAGPDRAGGGAGSDSLQGEAGNDLLSGEDGDDLVLGGSGNDVVRGGEGSDVLDGGGQRDTLVGGAGNDTLTGGSGVDRFVLNSLDGTDVITDFEPGVDVISLARQVFTGVGPLAVLARIDLAALGDAFRYDPSTGELAYDADLGGPGAAQVIARFDPALALGADFVLV